MHVESSEHLVSKYYIMRDLLTEASAVSVSKMKNGSMYRLKIILRTYKTIPYNLNIM